MRWKADRISTREEMSGCDGTKEAKSRRMLSTHQRFARIHSQFKIQHGWNVFRWEFADFKLKFISHLRSICFELISMAFQLDIFNLFFPSTDNQTTDSASFSQWLLVVSQVEARFEIDTHGSSIRVGWRQREMCIEWLRKSVWHRIIDCMRNVNIALTCSLCLSPRVFGWFRHSRCCFCCSRHRFNRLSNNRQYHLREASRTIACMYHTTAVARPPDLNLNPFATVKQFSKIERPLHIVTARKSFNYSIWIFSDWIIFVRFNVSDYSM